MKGSARNILRLLRPRQWIKNFAIFAPITFTGNLFNGPVLIGAIEGFFVLCGISSAIYVINDLFDREKDKLHPFKRFRPLAHGDISPSTGLLIAIILSIVSLYASYLMKLEFFVIIVVYLIVQFAYTVLLKNIEIIDILAIASGYILRVYSGEFISSLHISVWLLLTTVSISLFLAIGKRRSELTLVSAFDSTKIHAMRKSLSHYSERLLDTYVAIFATSTFVFYALFTFLENQRTQLLSNDIFLPQFLPDYLQRKWLMVTIVPVIYGLMRYLQKMYEKHEGESPERVLFTDRPLLISVIIWGTMVVVITYFQSNT